MAFEEDSVCNFRNVTEDSCKEIFLRSSRICKNSANEPFAKRIRCNGKSSRRKSIGRSTKTMRSRVALELFDIQPSKRDANRLSSPFKLGRIMMASHALLVPTMLRREQDYANCSVPDRKSTRL